MPSLCPKLESFIKVMHRRMAKNDQKFTKICFSRELSLKSGKINFHEFWTIFDPSGPHHLKKIPKKSQKWHHEKKNISEKKRKNADFFSAMSHKSSKNHQKIKIFVLHNVSCSQNHRKNFHGHWDNIHEMKSRFLKKKTFLKKSR